MRRGVSTTETRVELENDHRSSLNRADERLRDHILNLDSVRAIRRKFRVERFNTCSIIWQDVWGGSMEVLATD